MNWNEHFKQVAARNRPAEFGGLMSDVLTLPAYPGLRALAASDLQALVNAAYAIGVSPDWLATIINFESAGTFSPSKENMAGSGAVGLIQFMPSTAQGLLGTSTPQEAIERLKAMTFAQQLEIVKRYFAPYKGRLQSLADTYLAVLYPAFIGKAPDAVLGKTGEIIYQQNAGFDTTGKGYITKNDITSKIQSMLSGMTARLPVPGLSIASAEKVVKGLTVIAWISLISLAGVGGYLGYQHWRKTGRVLPTAAEFHQWKSDEAKVWGKRLAFLHHAPKALPPNEGA